MANLRRQAELAGALAVAPAQASLRAALGQAIADRNTAIRAASAGAKGISHAIHLAGPSVRNAYGDAARASKVSTEMAKTATAGTPFGAAMAREEAVGTQRSSGSLANALKELSDRRIEAASGRAYSTQRALGDYSITSQKLNEKGAELGARAGLVAANELAKLEQHASDQSFTAHENALGRRNTRINAALGRQSSLDRLTASENFQAHQNALGRRASQRNTQFTQGQQNLRQSRSLSAKTKNGGAKSLSSTEIRGRTTILQVRDHYHAQQGKPLHQIAGDIRSSKGAPPEPIIGAGADLATNGYVSPENVLKLEQIGVTVPKEWTGVSVRSHTRRRRGG